MGRASCSPVAAGQLGEGPANDGSRWRHDGDTAAAPRYRLRVIENSLTSLGGCTYTTNGRGIEPARRIEIKMPVEIFVSYRRSSDSGVAGRIYDGLTRELPSASIFMDVDKLNPGDDFEQGLDKSLGSCAVLLAIIGPDWADLRDENGQVRLRQEDDFVRKELATALGKGVRVVPVLVQGARLPPASALPPDLQALSKRQTVEIRHEKFSADVHALAKSIAATTPGLRRFRWRPNGIAVVGVAGVVAAAGVASLISTEGGSALLGIKASTDSIQWSAWLDQEGYQREFDRQVGARRYPRMIEAKQLGNGLVYRASFVDFPAEPFAFASRHSISDEQLARHEADMAANGFSRAYHQRITVEARAFNQGTWTKP